jgi:hypothetical protein
MFYVYNVSCMMCGRASGCVRNGAFERLPTAPPLDARGGRSRCGFCGGSLYLEAEDSPVVLSPIRGLDEHQTSRAS